MEIDKSSLYVVSCCPCQSMQFHIESLKEHLEKNIDIVFNEKYDTCVFSGNPFYLTLFVGYYDDCNRFVQTFEKRLAHKSAEKQKTKKASLQRMRIWHKRITEQYNI